MVLDFLCPISTDRNDKKWLSVWNIITCLFSVKEQKFQFRVRVMPSKKRACTLSSEYARNLPTLGMSDSLKSRGGSILLSFVPGT